MDTDVIFTRQIVIVGIILSLIIVVILSSISAGKTANSKCFKTDENLKKSYEYTKYTAILSGLLVGFLIAIYAFYFLYFKPKWRLTYVGFELDPIMLLLISIMGLLALSSLISSGLSTYYAHEASCKDEDSKEAFKYSLMCLIYSLIVFVIVIFAVSIYIYVWMQLPVSLEDVQAALNKEKAEIVQMDEREKRRTEREMKRRKKQAEVRETLALLNKLRDERKPQKKKSRVSPKRTSETLLPPGRQQLLLSESESEGELSEGEEELLRDIGEELEEELE